MRNKKGLSWQPVLREEQLLETNLKGERFKKENMMRQNNLENFQISHHFEDHGKMREVYAHLKLANGKVMV